MKHYNLKDRYALITGASSGIGREISRCFAEKGTNVVLGALPSERNVLETWAEELQDQCKVQTWPLPVDLADDEGPRTLHRKTLELIPHLDILVNNAGMLTYGSFQDVSLDLHEKLMRVNARAYMHLMHFALTHMMQRSQGRILNVSSMAVSSAWLSLSLPESQWKDIGRFWLVSP